VEGEEGLIGVLGERKRDPRLELQGVRSLFVSLIFGGPSAMAVQKIDAIFVAERSNGLPPDERLAAQKAAMGNPRDRPKAVSLCCLK